MRNAIGANRQTPQENAPACPDWCATHESVDKGTNDEAVIHRSRSRRAAGSVVWLQRWDTLAEGRPGAVEVWLDDEFLTRQQARARSEALVKLAGLVAKAADGDLS